MKEKMQKDEDMYTTDVIMITALTTVFTDSTCSKKAKEYRVEALQNIWKQVRFYQKEGFLNELVVVIAQKKSDMALSITTKLEAEKLSKVQPPHYDGNSFHANPYSCPEEELICWSLTSLKAPLSQVGFERYKELFCQIFPKDIAKTVFGEIV